jgi:hypothetical protein
MKEEDYTMKLMSTYGAQVEMDGGTTQQSVSAENGRAKVKKAFKYIEPFYNHFKFGIKFMIATIYVILRSL